MRLILVWEMASRLPTIMVSAARPHSTGARSTPRDGKAVTKMRSRAAKPAALAPTDMKAGHRGGRALVDIRRPHVEGDRRDLEAEPDQDQRRADGQQRQAYRRPGPEPAAAETISASEVVPVAPKTRAMP